MHLFRTTHGPRLHTGTSWHPLPLSDWDAIFNSPDLDALICESIASPAVAPPAATDLLAPIGTQEVWAAGVTYHRSRTARMEESKDAGGGTFYDRVYEAQRPEIFFKATPQRTVGPGTAMHLRRDSRWIVPEPELTLAINSRGEIIGCTIGNDLSCRDIEGENPLYLPQAKCFAKCAALGPSILLRRDPLPPETLIQSIILRAGQTVSSGTTRLDQLKRTPAELTEFLFRDNTFPTGAFLMTGTGIVPPDDFTLQSGDEVQITIDAIGTLSNTLG